MIVLTVEFTKETSFPSPAKRKTGLQIVADPLERLYPSVPLLHALDAAGRGEVPSNPAEKLVPLDTRQLALILLPGQAEAHKSALNLTSHSGGVP
jgi:hypothetical protein